MKTLDGSNVHDILEEIIEYKHDEMYAFSVNEDGEVVPTKAPGMVPYLEVRRIIMKYCEEKE